MVFHYDCVLTILVGILLGVNVAATSHGHTPENLSVSEHAIKTSKKVN